MRHNPVTNPESQQDILPAGLVNAADRQICLRSLRLLRKYLLDRSLVFFVGAGVSGASPTSYPVATELLRVLFEELVARLEQEGSSHRALPRLNELCTQTRDALQHMARSAGLEITLNDLRHTWAPGFYRFVDQCAGLGAGRPYNASHRALARWLAQGGTVVTTNYDSLIEEAYFQLRGHRPEVRYWTLDSHRSATPDATFDAWRDDLRKGGVLFKLHGSFDEQETCLATVEQVGTTLGGARADFLCHIIGSRPVCFVGWSGLDPDIPQALASSRDARAAPPVIWVLYEGPDPGSPFRLADRLEDVPPTLLQLASENPLVTEANTLFNQLLPDAHPPHYQKASPVRLRDALGGLSEGMPATSAGRFLGLVARRAGRLDLAVQLEALATELAEAENDWGAAVQERAHVLWQQDQRQSAVDEVARVSARLRTSDGLSARLDADFGELSMTVISARSHPTKAIHLCGLFRRYRRDIDLLEEAGGDRKEVHLHKALLHLYRGRLRQPLAGFVGRLPTRLLDSYVLGDFDRAKQHIDQSGDIHIHAKIDVLSYRALALARFCRCSDAWQDFAEAERLSLVLKDDARTKHLHQQRHRLVNLCGPARTT
jgi:hypothetical protein